MNTADETMTALHAYRRAFSIEQQAKMLIDDFVAETKLAVDSIYYGDAALGGSSHVMRLVFVRAALTDEVKGTLCDAQAARVSLENALTELFGAFERETALRIAGVRCVMLHSLHVTIEVFV